MVAEGAALHGLGNDVAHLQEPAAVFQKGAVDDFVGSIDDARHVAALLDGLECQCQTAELLEVRLHEVELLDGEEVQAVATQRQSLREGEGILDGQSHIGNAELCLDGTILELHGRMDNALRMYQHLNLTGIDTEEPLGLDDLKAFVHHGGRVDGNLRTHIPSRMAQCISLGDRLQLFHRAVAERTSRGGQENLLHGVVILAHQALEDSRVLAIDRQDRRVELVCQLTYQLASHHQRLLVGQGNRLVGLDSMDGGRKSGKAYHGGQYHVDGHGLYNLVESLCSGIDLHVGQVAHQGFQLVVTLLVCHDDGSRTEAVCLFSQQFHAVVGRQGIDLIEVAMLLDDLKCLRTDGAGRAQDAYLFFAYRFFLHER